MYSQLPTSLRHGVVTRGVTNEDWEREERTRCRSRERERERRVSEQVRRCGGERDKDIM
jgi:hypothetical protein